MAHLENEQRYFEPLNLRDTLTIHPPLGAVQAPAQGKRLSQAIKCLSVIVEQLVEFRIGATTHGPRQRFDPAGILRCLKGDGPVTAIHQASKAKTFQDVINVGLQVLLRPPLVIGFRYKSRYLAPDIGEAGQRL